MENLEVKIKFLRDCAEAPYHGSEEAAGYDLFAAIEEPIMIFPHQNVKIPTGIAIELPPGTFGGIYPRSGLATKRGLRPANCVGVIDADYRGEVMVALHNDSEVVRQIEPKERIAQLIVQPFYNVTFLENSLTDTERGDGGFGSTDCSWK